MKTGRNQRMGKRGWREGSDGGSVERSVVDQVHKLDGVIASELLRTTRLPVVPGACYRKER